MACTSTENVLVGWAAQQAVQLSCKEAHASNVGVLVVNIEYSLGRG